MMNIRLNGSRRRVRDSISVEALLRELDLRGRLAVEINQTIVSRSRYDHHCLQEGDQVEVIQAVGGG